MKLRSILIGLFALALVTSACGGSDDADDDTSAGSADEWRSPLAEYTGEGAGVDFSDEAAVEAKQLEVNEKVKSCMAAEGFEWQPDPQEQMMSGPPTDDEGLEWGSEEWTAKYGFGISTMAFPQDVVGPDLVGSSDSMMAGMEGEYVDPNQDYLSTLSDAEQQEFYATLYGDDQGPEMTEDMTEEEIQAAVDEYYADYVPTGCMIEAQEEIFGFGGGGGFYMEFQDELQTMEEQVQEDPRIAGFEQEIASCVADRDQSYTDMETVSMDFEKRMQPIYDDTWSQQPEVSEADMAEMTEEEMNALFAPKLSDENKALLGQIQADEIALAAAVQECGGNDEERFKLYREVYAEYEERFIEDNKAALDAYLAEQEDKGTTSGDSVGNGAEDGTSDTTTDTESEG